MEPEFYGMIRLFHEALNKVLPVRCPNENLVLVWIRRRWTLAVITHSERGVKCLRPKFQNLKFD